MDIKTHVTQVFQQRYGELPHQIVRAPGRVNLIGEHTDYNDGFVFPMAIDRAMWIAVRPRSDRQVSVWSADLEETIEFNLDNLSKGGPQSGEYIKGIAWVLLENGYKLTGWEGVMSGDVPIGSGLSSSAALELSVARAFASLSSIHWNAVEMAKLAQKAENQWVGMNCGIMDQMISAAGVVDHAVLIDCRSLEMTPAPLPHDSAVVILDTGTRRDLVDAAYNERRQQCETAARFFGVLALRDVTWQDFEAKADQLGVIIRQRARHVITENERTLRALDAMLQNDSPSLGELMNQSHVSLRDDFEVSSPALDRIVEIAQAQPGCYGARMTGGGFGGCAVALAQATRVADFLATVGPEYQAETGNTPQLYVCRADAGASVVA